MKHSHRYVEKLLALIPIALLNGCWWHTGGVAPFSAFSPTPTQYAFIHANVIPIQPSGVLSDYTVVVSEGVITAMGPTEDTPLPFFVTPIDLHGQYLLPGFSDMHVHLTRGNDLLSFLKHGITRVRNMAGGPEYQSLIGIPHVPRLRQAIQSHEVLGPDLTGCGPFLDGSPPENGLTTVIDTATKAREAVYQTVTAGYDCVKVYNRLKRSEFETIVTEARRWNIPVVGHIPYDVPLARALTAPMKSMEHLNAYLNLSSTEYRVPFESWQTYAQQTARAGLFNCPTLVLWEKYPSYQAFDNLKTDPRFATLPWFQQQFWLNSMPDAYDITYPDKARYASEILYKAKPLVKILHDAGAPLLIGTDANFTGVYPGQTALREMEIFAEVGIPNADILEIATLNAARFVGKSQTEGSIAVGKRAQLVVLKENPLKHIQAVYSTVGVMVQGHWLTLAELESLSQ